MVFKRKLTEAASVMTCSRDIYTCTAFTHTHTLRSRVTPRDALSSQKAALQNVHSALVF